MSVSTGDGKDKEPGFSGHVLQAPLLFVVGLGSPELKGEETVDA